MKAILFYLLSATGILAHDHGDHAFHHHRGLSQTSHGCGFRAPDNAAIEEMAVAQQERVARVKQEQYQASTFGRLFRCGDRGGNNGNTPTKITTYVNAIQKGDGTGYLSDTIIENNIKVTNELLRSAGFELDVVFVNRITNDAWYDAIEDSSDESNMYDSLKTGGLDTLNIYYKAAIGSDGNTYCGYAYLAEGAANVGNKDGIVMASNCATDKTTLAHEFGHWMNLLHTFDGGCSPGDLVDDTNAQDSYYGRNQTCPNPLPDTCPNQPGSDPLDNIMDYAPIQCEDRFTAGQANRIKEAWDNIRNV